MITTNRVHQCWLTAVVVAVLAATLHAGTVYETADEDGFFGGQGYLGSREIGQTITLAGTERRITSFEIGLGDNAPSEYALRFYDIDSNGQPGNVIWETVENYPWERPFYNRKVIAIDVPEVLVPDTFAWSIAPESGSNITIRIGDQIATGTPGTNWQWRDTDGALQENQFQYIAQLKIVAVPEPAAFLLAGLALPALLFVCRRATC